MPPGENTPSGGNSAHSGAGVGGQLCPRETSMAGAGGSLRGVTSTISRDTRPAVLLWSSDHTDANLSCRSQEGDLPFF